MANSGWPYSTAAPLSASTPRTTPAYTAPSPAWKDMDGAVILAEATPEAYREKGRFTPPDRPKRTRAAMEAAWTYPVVANGRLYIRELDSLWCYDVSGK